MVTVALVVIAALAVIKGVVVAHIFSATAAQRAALRWQRTIAMTIGATFALMGCRMIWSVLGSDATIRGAGKFLLTIAGQ